MKEAGVAVEHLGPAYEALALVGVPRLKLPDEHRVGEAVKVAPHRALADVQGARDGCRVPQVGLVVSDEREEALDRRRRQREPELAQVPRREHSQVGAKPLGRIGIALSQRRPRISAAKPMPAAS